MSHPCRIASCSRPAKDGQLMCWPHWRGLPRRLKDAIFETYRNGPHKDYAANVEEAVRLIDEKEGRAR
jgi:hypothetical protein